MIKRAVILIIAFLLFIPLAFSQASITDYNESGRFDNKYQLGLGRFNSQLDPDEIDVRSETVTVTNGRKLPLISDLDGDGVAEIIILDGESIEIYQNKTLDFVAGFDLNTASDERFSNIITFDIDGDGLREIIIVAEKEKELHILEYNRSILINQTRFEGIDLSELSFTNATNFPGEVAIKCSSTERCLMTYSSSIRSGNTPGVGRDLFFFATFFNSSQEGISSTFETKIDSQINSVFNVFCQPNIRHIAVADYDEDGDIEFIATNMMIAHNFGGDEVVNIYWIDILSNHNVVLEKKTVSTRPDDIFTVTSDDFFTCDNSGGNNINKDGIGPGFPLFPGLYVSSPLVFDADLTKTGLETIVGMGKSPNDFIMVVFKRDGSEIGRFPSTILGDSEGIMISNVFQADIFDGSSKDFCIMGFNGNPVGAIEDSLSVTCGSLRDTNGFGLLNVNTLEFRFDKEGRFNLSQDYDVWDKIAHSAEYDSTNDLDEVISAYGTLRLNRDSSIFSSCFLTGDCDMDLIFESPKQVNNPRVIATDAYDRFGLEDWIILTDSNLFYLDDLLTNQPISSFNFTINPCIDSVYKINTSIQVRMRAFDPEGDAVAVRTRIYSGTSNEQDSGFINASSGGEVTTSITLEGNLFTANLTGGGFSLIMEAKDVENNPDTIISQQKFFSVAVNGVETFDCTTVGSTVVVVDAEEVIVIIEEATLTEDATVNSVTSGVLVLGGILGLAGTTIWLIIMLAISIGIWGGVMQANRGGFQISGSSALGAIALVNLLLIVLGARLGILSVALVVIIVVIAVVILGIFLGRFLTGLGTNNG